MPKNKPTIIFLTICYRYFILFFYLNAFYINYIFIQPMLYKQTIKFLNG